MKCETCKWKYTPVENNFCGMYILMLKKDCPGYEKMPEAETIEKLRKRLDYIKSLASVEIPYYAFGNNEAAVYMSKNLREIKKVCQGAEKE